MTITVKTVGRNGVDFPDVQEMSVGNALVDLVFRHMATDGFGVNNFVYEGGPVVLEVRRSTIVYNERGREYSGHRREMKKLMSALRLFAYLDNRVGGMNSSYWSRVTRGYVLREELDLYADLRWRFDDAASIALAVTGYLPPADAGNWTPEGLQILVAGLVDEDYSIEDLLELAATA